MTDKELRSAGQYDVGSPCDLELCTSALSITALPTEVLAHVFEYLPYRVVAQDLRLVSRRFRDVATLVLNSGFLTLGPTIERTKMVVKSRVMQAPAETELTTVCRTLYELKTLKSEYCLLTAVTRLYIVPVSGAGPLACFYAGLLLDVFLALLRALRQGNGDQGVFGFSFYYIEDQFYGIRRLCVLSTSFMNHFEQTTEKKLISSYAVSGSKIVDLLDCLLHYNTKPYQQAVSLNGTRCHIKAHYRMKGPEFICRDTPCVGVTREQDQMFIYRHVRKLVSEYNKYVLQETLYRVESALRKSDVLYMSFLEPSMYYEHVNHFFNYETNNEQAFSSMLRERECTNINSFGFNMDLFFSDHEYTSEAKLPNEETPAMYLDVNIEVQCPPELAPLQYLDQIHVPSCDVRTNGSRSPDTSCAARTGHEEEFLLKMTWRGPSTFEYVIKSSDFDGRSSRI